MASTSFLNLLEPFFWTESHFKRMSQDQYFYNCALAVTEHFCRISLLFGDGIPNLLTFIFSYKHHHNIFCYCYSLNITSILLICETLLISLNWVIYRHIHPQYYFPAQFHTVTCTKVSRSYIIRESNKTLIEHQLHEKFII